MKTTKAAIKHRISAVCLLFAAAVGPCFSAHMFVLHVNGIMCLSAGSRGGLGTVARCCSHTAQPRFLSPSIVLLFECFHMSGFVSPTAAQRGPLLAVACNGSVAALFSTCWDRACSVTLCRFSSDVSLDDAVLLVLLRRPHWRVCCHLTMIQTGAVKTVTES